jgi:secretion/DNA translocation related TadE-like protein
VTADDDRVDDVRADLDPRTSNEAGSGTVLGAAVLLAVLTLLLAGLSLGGVVVAVHRARAAADLAALAGASVLGRGGNPQVSCAEASSVAAANGGTLARCEAMGLDLVVEAQAPTPSLVGGLIGRVVGPARATSRAGPPLGGGP